MAIIITNGKHYITYTYNGTITRQKVIENRAWKVYIIFKIRLGNIGNESINCDIKDIPESDSKRMENRRVLLCWQQ